jgi:hypothetical protein
LGLFLTVILVPLSFERIEYYEAGIKSRSSTGTVYRDEIYSSGNHFIGPDYTFKKFPVSVLGFNQAVAVWTKSGGNDAGATLTLDISFQYKLKAADLGKLYAKVAQSYEPLVVTYALDAIKNTAPLYGADEYLTKREVIEQAFLKNVTKNLNDNIFCEVLDLQMRNVGLSADFKTTKLNTAIQVETNAKEIYVQDSTIIVEKTSLQVLEKTNEATETANAATAEANVIKEQAIYLAKQTVETARSNGLKHMLNQTGLTTERQKASLDYITSLINNKKKIKPYINLGAGLQKAVA